MINTPQKLLPALAKPYHGSSRGRKDKTWLAGHSP